MKNKKEKRINRIKKVIDKDFFANGERNEKSMRTMLVGIQTKNYKNNKVLDKETRRKLDIIMNDVYEKKLEVLNICKEIFYNDRQALINFASNYINIKENKLDLQLYIENDLTFNSPFICKECGKPEKVYFTVEEKKDKDGNLKYNKKTGEVEYKYSYCSACEDLKHTTKAVILEKKEIDENDEENNKKGKQTIFIITKFSEQTLWTNYISPIINTKNPQKKTLEKFKLDANYKNEHCDFKSKTIYGAENLRMPVHLSISGTVCSFLDKYYNIQTDIQKTISDNKKMENDIYAVLPKITKLPISVSTKQENDEYNKIVKSNNILINLYNQQQPNKESRLRQFKHLKGFPSFPIVEKQKQEVDYVELDNLLSPHLENAKLFWDTINIEQFQNAMAHFCGRIIYKLFKYYYKIDAIEPDSKNFKYILKDWKKADIKIRGLTRIFL